VNRRNQRRDDGTNRSGRRTMRDLVPHDPRDRRSVPLRRAMAHARNVAGAMGRCVPGGRGAARAGRARASSAPPRARAARRSQNPSRRVPHLVAGLATDWFRWWVRRVAHCDGERCGFGVRGFYTGRAEASAACRGCNPSPTPMRICDALSRSRLTSGVRTPVGGGLGRSRSVSRSRAPGDRWFVVPVPRHCCFVRFWTGVRRFRAH